MVSANTGSHSKLAWPPISKTCVQTKFAKHSGDLLRSTQWSRSGILVRVVHP